ncbi:MAG: lecithin retinol acyltransferase family protein [Burkholderiaceae bacterium]
MNPSVQEEIAQNAPSAALPLPGAHLITPRRGYTHHGIYVGSGRVIHYAGLCRGFHRGAVEETTLEAFAEGRGWSVEARQPARFGKREVVRRARSRIGENDYQIVTNNCEHFCAWCRVGEARSEQVETWRKWLGVAPSLRLLRAIAAFSRACRPVLLPALVRAS